MSGGPESQRQYPSAKSARSPDEREKLKRVIGERGLVGLANDTKWDEFLAAMRPRAEGKKPWRFSYRYKCVTGFVQNTWDVEWFYHLPFPLIGMEWIDVAFIERTWDKSSPPRELDVDHSPWLEEVLRRIGLDYLKGTQMIRIFGFGPRDLSGFDIV